MTPHKWAKEIHAFADGYEIEEFSFGNYWYLQYNPYWNDTTKNFRIKTRHQAVKDAFEAGEEVEFKIPGSDIWGILARGCGAQFYEDWEYRVKERVFPTTSLSDKEIIHVWHATSGTSIMSMRAIANESIKQYILDQEK